MSNKSVHAAVTAQGGQKIIAEIVKLKNGEEN